MGLREYFETLAGYGVLATADREGRVDVAIYSVPYIVDDTTIAFIMADRMTRKNLKVNPYAAYLFQDPAAAFQGRRLYLTMEKELKDQEVTEPELKEKYDSACREYSDEDLYVVYFRVDRALELIGDKDA